MTSAAATGADRLSTSERIIVTAERLFSERGPNAVSLREVSTEAGQRNSGVVQYHFGDKESLLTAILEFRMGDVERARARLLDELDATGRSHDLRGLLEAFVLPLATEPGPGSHHVRFMAQLLADSQRSGALACPPDTSLRTLWMRIGAALAPAVRDDRLRMVANLTIHTIADHDGEPTDARTPWVLDLVEAAAAVLAAPARAGASQ